MADTAYRLRARRAAIFLFGCACPLLGPVRAPAAEWTVEPLVNLTYEVNDNRALTTGPHDTVHGFMADVSAKGVLRSETSEWSLTPRYFGSRYRGDEANDFDADDGYLDGRYLWNGPRDQFSIAANGARNTTLTTEASDVGLVDVRVPRDAWGVRPSWQHRLNEVTSTRIGASHDRVAYEDGGSNRLVDYVYQTADISLLHDWTPRWRLGATLYAAHLDASEINSESDNRGLMFSAEYRYSEATSLGARGGYRRTDFEVRGAPGVAREGHDNGGVAGLTFRHEGERTRVDADVDHSVNSSGFGFLVKTLQLKLGITDRITARTSLIGDVLAFRNRAVDDRVTSDDRDYYRITGGVAYRVTPWWSLRGTLSYTRQEFVNASQAANAHAAFLTLSYSGDRLAQGSW
jgi:hypothetical protein